MTVKMKKEEDYGTPHKIGHQVRISFDGKIPIRYHHEITCSPASPEVIREILAECASRNMLGKLVISAGNE